MQSDFSTCARKVRSTSMRVMVLYNPIAGAGRAAEAARTLPEPLEAAGHDVALLATSLEPQKSWLDPALADVDAMVVVGGDGALRLASGAASRTDTPIYHFPLGTENLFSREFGFDRSPERLVKALARNEVQRIDLGIANQRKFLLMASVGFDAEVIHDLSAHRTGGISHLTYVRPIARQFMRWRPSPMTILIDGEPRVTDRAGCAIVGNCRQYCQRIDPAVNASMSDAVLDVVFMEVRSRLELARWAIACRMGRHVKNPRLFYERGQRVEIVCAEPQRYQLDGDPPEQHPSDGDDELISSGFTTRLEMALRPGVLPVLVP